MYYCVLSISLSLPQPQTSSILKSQNKSSMTTSKTSNQLPRRSQLTTKSLKSLTNRCTMTFKTFRNRISPSMTMLSQQLPAVVAMM